jgi:hypothetical protein
MGPIYYIGLDVGFAVSPHPPQPPEATSQRLYRTRAELHACLDCSPKRASGKVLTLARTLKQSARAMSHI